MYTTLIDAAQLAQHLDDPNWVIVDCRFELANLDAGRAAYEQSHIAGAVYAHLNDELSGPPVTDAGRHPLPTPSALTLLFGRLGIDSGKQVVVYDANNGALAARLWWMLRYMGHDAVAVLDGGWTMWLFGDYARRSGVEQNEMTLFTGEPRTDWLVLVADVADQPLLIDSREPPRYRGETEPIDPKPGHIPGAVNYWFQRNWKSGRYQSPEKLAASYSELLGGVSAESAVFYCGSGVTACANLLALTHSGLGDGRLYVGSWSEWSSDDSRPIATGSEPG